MSSRGCSDIGYCGIRCDQEMVWQDSKQIDWFRNFRAKLNSMAPHPEMDKKNEELTELPKPVATVTTIGYDTIPRSNEPSKVPIPSVGQSPAKLENFIINFEELEFGSEIGKDCLFECNSPGRGAYGVVYKGYWRGGIVAIKQAFPQKIHTHCVSCLLIHWWAKNWRISNEKQVS